LDFYEFEILSAERVLRASVRHRAKFLGDRSTHCRDIYGDILIVKMAAIRQFGLLKVEILTADRALRVQMRQLVDFRCDQSNMQC